MDSLCQERKKQNYLVAIKLQKVCELRQLSAGQPHANPKFFDEYKLSGFKWKNRSKIWWHVVDSAEISKTDMKKSEIEYRFRQLERQWELACNLLFTPTRYIDKADIVVNLADIPPPIYGKAQWDQVTIALGAYPIGENRIAGDMWFNTKHYKLGDYPKYAAAGVTFDKFTQDGLTDFGSAGGHELGHTIGIGHSSDPAAVMAAYYKKIFPFKLHIDDEQAAEAIYNMNTSYSQKLLDKLRGR